jgi:plasmid stability protein
MANLTITIDDEILRRARVRAMEQDQSVNSLLREYLEAYAAAGSTWEHAAEALLRLSAGVQSGRGKRRWTRDELHER